MRVHDVQMLPTDPLTLVWVPRRFQTQMQYGSIGWSVGACLGCAVGSRYHKQRLLLFVGDGCFQIGAQVTSQQPFQWSQHLNLTGAQVAAGGALHFHQDMQNNSGNAVLVGLAFSCRSCRP